MDNLLIRKFYKYSWLSLTLEYIFLLDGRGFKTLHVGSVGSATITNHIVMNILPLFTFTKIIF